MHLLFIGSPPTVIRRIRTIVVDAVKCQARWFLAHVGKEVFKQQPSFTNRNASTAPVFITAVSRIAATSNHPRPTMVSRSDSAAMRVSMLRIALNQIFSMQATAGLRNSTAKYNALKNCTLSASAFNQPSCLTLLGISGAADNGPTFEGLSGEINGVHNETFIYELSL